MAQPAGDSSTLERLGTTLFFAALGYITTAANALRSQQHRARVDRVNEQLKSLYGPLLACVTASKSSYDAMLRQAGASSPAEFRARVRADPDGPAARAYRSWVRVVLMPLSETAAQTVMQRADLLEGSEISPLLLQLVAHVSAYRVILKSWEQGDQLTEHSHIPYPEQLEQWVSNLFDELKRRQSGLLGIQADGGMGSPLMRFITSRL
jgi:hypothetical protein